MSQVLLNVEFNENDGVYSIILGDKVVDLDTETFKQLQVITYDTSTKSTYNKEEYEKELERQYKEFYEEYPNFGLEFANEQW